MEQQGSNPTSRTGGTHQTHWTNDVRESMAFFESYLMHTKTHVQLVERVPVSNFLVYFP